ncbi:hypothetical protein B0A48_07358 [Cryoendolithus antarcticus]|uniref:Eukaryotic translation initiation factor 3 subunit J n=1 Tax=Cryoendolithus antarcticus TaxID=1507870 RepID=A0A1V8T8T4_9PEZI|nr:hypothetical protein B0A48_07358 [Cryoendolithus antarcticus]
MAPSKANSSWDDEESDSTAPSSPIAAPVVVAPRRSKFDDEEDDDDVLDSWDAAEDSEVEREKTKKAAEAKAKADAAAQALKKSKGQRLEEIREKNMRRKLEQEMEAEVEESEDEGERRRRMREEEKLADLANAEDLLGMANGNKKTAGPKVITIQEGSDPSSAIDLSSLKLFDPQTAGGFTKLKETMVPLLAGNNAKKAQYPIFMQDFTKQLVKDLNSDQIKKIATILSTMSNEKMKEEKAADKGAKKTKAAKTKPVMAASRNVAHMADTTAYDDDLGDDDFM